MPFLSAISPWALLIFAMARIGFAQSPTGYCAFEIRVSNPDGRPAAKIPAGLSKDGHSLFESLTDEHGVVRICDSPVTSVDVFAGLAPCGLAMFKSVKPFWGETRVVRFIYDQSGCGEFVSHQEICHFVLRVQDSSGHLIEGARFNGSEPGAVRSVLSDYRGRLFVTLKEGQYIKGTLAKDGFKTSDLSERCTVQLNGLDRDVPIILRQ